MNLRLSGSVTIPKRPSSVGGLLAWARGVNRTLAELRDRRIAGVVARPVGGGAAELELPFQIYDNGTEFVSRAGTFNGSYGELTQAATTDGTWRLYASLTINATTGEITASSVAWYASAQTSTTTTFYHLIGIGIVADSGETRTVINYNYGPIFFLLHGSVTDDWNCSFY
jgi:hypothetical protein